MGLWKDIQACQACPLHKSMICQPIPGFTTNRQSDVMLVGEAPGSEECFIEKPFQGLAGKLLTKMLSEAGINRDNLYITNVVKCRPTVNDAGKKNRPPTKAEISLCCGWLDKEITIVNPKIVITLGNIPTQLLLKDKKLQVTKIVGKEVTIDNRIYIPMLHPSYILQYSKDKMQQFTDIMKNLKAKYEFCKW